MSTKNKERGAIIKRPILVIFLALLLGEIVAMIIGGAWVLLPIVAASIIIKIIAKTQWGLKFQMPVP